MQTKYSDPNIHFSLEGYRFDALNIVFERFTRTIPSHSHGSGCYEIHCIPTGYGKLEADGAFCEIGPNTVYVTGPHVRHAQTPIPRDPMQEYCIYLKVRSPHTKKMPTPLMDIFLAMPFWYGNDSQGIIVLVKQLFEELERRRTGYLLQAELLLSQLILSLVRSYEQTPGKTKTDSIPDSDSGKSVIIEEYFLYEYSHLSLEELARRLNLSPRQTQRLLLEYYGNTFQQKKAEARMSAAAILLGERDRSITSIAETLGYSSPEHFSSEFKKYYGTSPRSFKNQTSYSSEIATFRK